jgi:hypothetical protein
MSSDREPALEVFFSYSHRDEDLRDALETHLALLEREGAIRTWHDRRIGAGREWQGEIDRHLEKADLILLLISPDFIASDYCFDLEMSRALERHAAGEARVIPILLRPGDWRTARFASLQVLPADGRPITAWPDRDSAFADVARGIRTAVAELREIRDPAQAAAYTWVDSSETRRPLRVRLVASALIAAAAAAIGTYLAVRSDRQEGPSAAEVQAIFASREEGAEVLGRLGLRLLEGGSQPGRPVGVDHSFHTGDFFRFEVTSSRDGWLYVFHRPPGGRLELLWPARGESSANAVRAFVPTEVPPGEDAFLFTDEIGEELFYVALVAGPAARAPGDPENLERRVESLISRDLHASIVPSRRRRVIVARPDEDRHVYFTAGDGADAAVELRLRHDASGG